MTTRQPDLIERLDAWITSKIDAVVDWTRDHPRAASSVFALAICFLLLLTMLVASPSHALDPECDPLNPGYNPHTAAVYVSLAGTVRLCTSLDNPAGGRDIDETQPVHCLLLLDAKPYAMTDVAPGQEILLTIDAEDLNAAHSAELTCTAFMVAQDGSTHERTSSANTFLFDPVPAPEAPVPLP